MDNVGCNVQLPELGYAYMLHRMSSITILCNNETFPINFLFKFDVITMRVFNWS